MSKTGFDFRECATLDEALIGAAREAGNVTGLILAGTLYQQGPRMGFATAMPVAIVVERMRSAPPKRKLKGGLSLREAYDAYNRPVDEPHIREIADYIRANRHAVYHLGGMICSALDRLAVYTTASNSRLPRAAFLVLPASARLPITDGQHRCGAMARVLDELGEQSQQAYRAFAEDAVPVVIIPSSTAEVAHQDFADAARSRPLPASLVALYDRRNIANRLVIDLEQMCPLLRGKIDATSQRLGEASAKLFTANQVRMFAKVAITGSAQTSTANFDRIVRERIAGEGDYSAMRDWLGEFINHLAARLNVFRAIVETDDVRQAELVPSMRKKFVCLTPTGLAILGRFAYEFHAADADWKPFADRLAGLDWRRSHKLWHGTIISGDAKAGFKIATHSAAIRGAIEAVSAAIDWRSASVPSPTP